MTQDTLILIGLAIIAVPLLGTALAMLLGLLTTLTRDGKRPGADVQRALERGTALETRLRRVAAMLGCYVLDRLPARAVRARGPNDARVTPDRRISDRRGFAARRSTRADAERRRQDRRQRERRHRQDLRKRV